MTGTITWEVVFGIATIIATVAGVWWRIEGRIKASAETVGLQALAAHAKADVVVGELAKYQLHVAETYATKNSVNQQYEAVSKSISAVGERVESRLDGMNERLDQVILSSHRPSTPRRTQN